ARPLLPGLETYPPPIEQRLVVRKDHRVDVARERSEAAVLARRASLPRPEAREERLPPFTGTLRPGPPDARESVGIAPAGLPGSGAAPHRRDRPRRQLSVAPRLGSVPGLVEIEAGDEKGEILPHVEPRPVAAEDVVQC